MSLPYGSYSRGAESHHAFHADIVHCKLIASLLCAETACADSSDVMMSHGGKGEQLGAAQRARQEEHQPCLL